MPPLEANNRFAEAAFLNVVARPQHQGGIGAGFIAWSLLMHFAGQSLGIKID